MFRSIALFAALAECHAVAPARAETTQCTNITSLPAIIATQGVYCLKQDLATAITSGAAITINTNNVTLDCNDWKIGGLAAGIATNAVGIVATDRLNITVRHCGVRGFATRISLIGDTNSAGHLVEDNRLDFNTTVGLEIFGDGDVVRRNRVVDTGGRPGSPLTDGIRIGGTAAVVSDNLVLGVSATGDGSRGNTNGVNVFGETHEFSRNFVTGLVPFGTGVARACYGSQYGSYRDNTAVAVRLLPLGGFGIDGGGATSMCNGNHVRGFAVSLSACTDVGDNAAN